jgi:hypothetical protein
MKCDGSMTGGSMRKVGSSASILPKQRQFNGAFAAYLTRRW